MNDERKDSEFLRNRISSDIELPESLSAENIARLVSGEKQQRGNKKIIRRFVAAGIAACVAITSAVVIPAALKDEPSVNSNEGSNISVGSEAEQQESYDELIGAIKSYAEKYKKENDRGNNFYFTTDDATIKGDSDMSVNESMSATAGGGTADTLSDFSAVNLREENVYESDVFITDGEYFYGISNYGRNFVIVKADSGGKLKKVYETDNEYVGFTNGNGEEYYYSGLYRYESYLIVSFSKYTIKDYKTEKDVSGVLIYDVSDKTAPVFIKEISLDGYLISSRIIGDELLVISRYSIIKYFSEENEENFIPAVYNGGTKTCVPCDCITYSADDKMESYVNVAKINLKNTDEIAVSSFLGNATDTYCTEDTLYIMGTSYSYSSGIGILVDMAISSSFSGGACTTITKIDISGEKAEVKGRAELDGSILNSYAIDEYKGYLRVALQKNSENCIYVYDESLSKVGEITGIAPGEYIRSARFMGNTAYLVTFVQTDPLFVIDLSSPEKPEIAGEVKLPGFSAYLHPVGDGLLAGIGSGGTESGTDGSSKISLFDVRDPSCPKEIDSLTFPTSYLGTEAKAFVSVSENTFLVPYSNWQLGVNHNQKFNSYTYYVYSGALLVSAENDRLVLRNSYFVKGENTVIRAGFIDDYVYLFGDGEGQMASFNMTSGEFIDALVTENDETAFIPSELTAEEILGISPENES